MEHIELLLHIVCLISGILVTVLGYFLYLKYRNEAIKYFTLYLSVTVLTVIDTAAFTYAYYFGGFEPSDLFRTVHDHFFVLILTFLNLTFMLFGKSILSLEWDRKSRIIVSLPWIFTFLGVASNIVYGIVHSTGITPGISKFFQFLVLAQMLGTFIHYSVRILIHMKFFDNFDLRRALKVFAVIYVIHIPVQVYLVISQRTINMIMLSRNVLYLIVNIVSIIFAGKYFFLRSPNILGEVKIGEKFTGEYSITEREKEVIELLLSGLTIKAISEKLYRSFKTVNNHIYNIYRKTGVGSKIELLNLIKEKQI